MNEQTMIWFLQKTHRYPLSREAVSLWMDFYAYLQHLNRACNPQIPFFLLQSISDLDGDALQTACQELHDAGMLQLQFTDGQLICRLIAGRLCRTLEPTAG